MIKNFKEFEKLNESNEKDMYIYKVVCRDSEGTLKELIEYIGANGNGGHSFEIVVDPNMTKEEGKRSFFWDGDGSDRVEKVEVIQEPTLD